MADLDRPEARGVSPARYDGQGSEIVSRFIYSPLHGAYMPSHPFLLASRPGGRCLAGYRRGLGAGSVWMARRALAFPDDFKVSDRASIFASAAF